MPTVRRERTVAAPPETVWELVRDPSHLPRWWPDIERVEDASDREWTTVQRSRHGRPVRADYTRVRAERPRVLRWRQEVEETPFEGFLAEAETEVSLAPLEGGEGTRVGLEAREKLRGVSTLGAFMVKRATRRRLDRALEGLAYVLGEDGA